MHPVVARRCNTPLTVYPFKQYYMGDKIFGDPYELKCYSDYRTGVIPTASGEDRVYKTLLYIPGAGAEHLSDMDEIEVLGAKRTPPLAIRPLPSLTNGIELVVVYI